MFSEKTYRQRREELRKGVERGGIILLPGNVESPRNYPDNAFHHRQDSTFLYFFGLQLPKLVGVLDIEAGKDYLFGDDYTMSDIIWMGPQPSIKELGAKCGIEAENVFTSEKVHEVVTAAIRLGRPVHFLPPYRGDNRLRLIEWLGIKPGVLKDYVSEDLIDAVVRLRSIKSDEEIAQMEDACEIGYRMHTRAMQMAKPGVSEREIAGEIEGIALKYGLGMSFHPIVSQHGETLHNHSHDGILETGRLLLVDTGAENVYNYCSDHTRTLPVGGKFTPRQKDIYEIVLAANDRAFEIAKPGMLYRDVHLEAVTVIARGLIALGLMKGDAAEAVAKGAHALFMPHGLGHMMGLDVHDMEDLGENNVGYDRETARSRQLGHNVRMGRRLAPGMAISSEPGIYFIPAYIAQWKEQGLNAEFINFDKLEAYTDFGGIRLEDDLLVTSTGSRILGSRRIPITVAEVEEAMRG
jgi:Xaa-Pro aminopeptidase